LGRQMPKTMNPGGEGTQSKTGIFNHLMLREEKKKFLSTWRTANCKGKKKK